VRDHVSRETVHGEWPVGGNEKGSGQHAQMHSTRSCEHLKYVNDAKCERQSGEWQYPKKRVSAAQSTSRRTQDNLELPPGGVKPHAWAAERNGWYSQA